MSYYSLDGIKSVGRFSNILQKNLERGLLSNKTTVFLSHSHKDEDVIVSVIGFLISIGVYIYVDWLDPDMPRVTSAETATKIKCKIIGCEKFVVLLTENSKESKWVPWELGYADGNKLNKDIAVLPVRRNPYTNDSEFSGLEYMQLYRQIKPGTLAESVEGIPGIFPPTVDKGIFLNSWLGG